MLEVGEHVPDARVWIRPHEPVSIRELAREGPLLLLLLFYLFDWSST